MPEGMKNPVLPRFLGSILAFQQNDVKVLKILCLVVWCTFHKYVPCNGRILRSNSVDIGFAQCLLCA